MAIRVNNLRLSIFAPEDELPARLANVLGVGRGDIADWRVVRKSLDARDKRAVQFVYNAVVNLPAGEGGVLSRAKSRSAQILADADPPFAMPKPGPEPLGHRPVVVGSGPGGLAAAYFLAEAGYRPLVLERGTPVNERIQDVRAFDAGGTFAPQSNYLFGEGGAGTFSDGKLTCRNTGPDVLRVLELFAECKGKPSILYEHRPHLGSNRLPAVVKAMRRKIIEMGGEVRFHCQVDDIEIQAGRVTSVRAGERVPASAVILAIGHSARDTFRALNNAGVPLERKPFQMGVRVEHSQETVNRVQYGRAKLEERLGNADYTLTARGSADLFTFCMCAGGYVIPSVSQEGHFCTNGMSLSKRDSPYANSGLVVTIPLDHFPGDDPLAGVRLQEECEAKAFALGGGGYACPAQRAVDFLAGRAGGLPRCSYPRRTFAADLRRVLPPFAVRALETGLPLMDRRWGGRFLPEAVLVGPEARGSSPVRIVRDNDTRQSPGVAGLYPVGEGAGYAGGIVSAAVDGLKTAKAVIARHARPA